MECRGLSTGLKNCLTEEQRMSESRYDEFVDSLKELPLSVWKATPCESISWKLLKPFSNSWEFGHFASLFVALGLNDYATIGKAEVGYWPKIVPEMSPYIDPANPLELIDILRPLFTNERLGQKKVKRLEMFARSALCSRVWGSTAPAIASEFTDIRIQLGKTMNQKPTDETIALAIKCLAFALLMVDEVSFDYGAIPVPVDSRIRCLSARLGLPNADEDTERLRWAGASSNS